MDFLEDKIITTFSVPMKITTDKAKVFSSTILSTFCLNYVIVLSHSSNYYAQGNGLAESSNKNLMNVIMKTVSNNKKNWDSKLKHDWMTKKDSTIYKILLQFSTYSKAMLDRINQLAELDQTSRHAYGHHFQSLVKTKRKFDKGTHQHEFQKGDLVLLPIKKGKNAGNHSNFESFWLEEYQIEEPASNNTFYLCHLNRERLPCP
eukprot:PITA_32014